MMTALFSMHMSRVVFMNDADDKISGTVKKVEIAPAGDMLTTVTGETHAVMQVIGAIADHGEDTLISARQA